LTLFIAFPLDRFVFDIPILSQRAHERIMIERKKSSMRRNKITAA
jgi:hypothetical protein